MLPIDGTPLLPALPPKKVSDPSLATPPARVDDAAAAAPR